ncbi:glutamate carboxypeptidase like protein [Verticillium longisporum]|nr:glutamate carboxypeptidase like protein [Verticillium longisporum]
MAVSPIELIPCDPESEEHIERLYQQRLICGWQSKDVRQSWTEDQKRGTKGLYWIEKSLLIDTSISIRGRTRTASMSPFLPLGHVSLDAYEPSESSFKFNVDSEATHWINGLYVSPALQGSGIGRAAMDCIENLAVQDFKAKTLVLASVKSEDQMRPDIADAFFGGNTPKATALSQIGQVKSPDRRLPRSHPQKPDALGMNELPEPLSAVLAFAAGASACQRDFNIEARHTHRKPILRRNDVWPPVLTEQETLIANSFDNVTIDEWSEYYGRQNKLAGFGKEAAEWTRDKWASNGFESHLNEYHVFLRYPVSAALNFTDAEGNVSEINLKEDVIEDDEVTGWDAISQQTFLGYAPTGHAKAEYVYAGRGSKADFDALAELGVDVKGKIALIRYGGLFRGLKVKNAQDAGALAAVIYLDPGDDGEVTVANGYKAYPEGPARNPHQVQKGSTLFLSTQPGDPTTPGYPSHEDAPRADVSDVIAKIPAVNRTNWIGGLDAEYSTGPAPGVTLELDNVSEDVIRPIQNVIGRINGTNHDGTPAKETLFIGNHRDTWMIGGNGDPNSGSAILIEFSKVIKKLIDSGWKPKRNLVLGSWDAEEYF